MTQQDYEHKRAECFDRFCRRYGIEEPSEQNIESFNWIFYRAYALAIQNSDDVWEKNMTETFKMLDEMTSKFGFPEEDVLAAAEWIKNVTYDVLQGIMKPETISQVIKLTKLHSDASNKGATCTSVEDAPSIKPDVPSSESKQARPKFKVGDKVKILGYNGYSGMIDTVRDISKNFSGRNIYYLDNCMGPWSDDSLEPYTEPSANYAHVDWHLKEGETAASTQDFDNIVNRGFRDHNRLHVATQILAGMVHSWWNEPIPASRSFNESCRNLVETSLKLADMLIAECKKGGAL